MSSQGDPSGKGFALDAATWGRVSLVLERLSSSSDLAEVLNLIIDSMRDCLHADRATVFRYDAGREELFSSQAHGVAEIRFPISADIAGESARTRRIINVPDCYADARFNRAVDLKTGYRTCNMLAIPLVAFDGGLQGVAQVLNKHASHTGGFDAYDEQIARVLASQAAVAIRRAQSIEAESRKKKLEYDLGVAKTIQQSSWPRRLPAIPGYSIAARSQPAEETGGDAFDVVDLSTFAGGVAGGGAHPGAVLILGDATGHGIGPALSAMQFRAMVRMGARLGCPVEQITRFLNAQLCEDLPAGRFVTAFVGRLDPEAHELRYDSMGQAPLLLVRRDGSVDNRAANGMPMGIDAELLPEPVEPFRLEAGDVFALISDGYFEAVNRAGEQFGEDRAIEAVRSAMQGSAADMLSALDKAVEAFVDGHPFHDDRTAILVRREG